MAKFAGGANGAGMAVFRAVAGSSAMFARMAKFELQKPRPIGALAVVDGCSRENPEGLFERGLRRLLKPVEGF